MMSFFRGGGGVGLMILGDVFFAFFGVRGSEGCVLSDLCGGKAALNFVGWLGGK